MPFNRSSIFLEVIESLSKCTYISEGDDLSMSKEILFKASHFLKIPRVNAWLMDGDQRKLKNILAYDRTTDVFYTESELFENDLPIWFNHIIRNDIIISNEAQKESFNSELLEGYLIPLNISSMMEVPILLGGKLKGIVCFENTGEIRNWSNDEQHFALALTQLLTLTLETKEKNIYRDELEKLVNEKSILIAEINHRVKNNLSVITALIRAESNRAKDKYHKDLFDNILTKSFSLSTLQSSMYKSENYKQADFSDFIKTLVANINETYGFNKNVKIDLDLEDLKIDVSKAIPCSLIVNELITNSYKHAFRENKVNNLSIKLSRQDSNFSLIISDNGPGLTDNYTENGTGYELINGLTEQIDGKLNIDSSESGMKITLTF